MDFDWRNKEFSFFNHSKCEWFPCHKTKDPDSFNCLFCYCPLYALDDKCGGSFSYIDSDIKDCSNCKVPHVKDNYEYIMDKFTEISAMMKENRKQKK